MPHPALTDAAPPTPLLVACLCAGWCTACEAYKPVLAALAAAHPALRFAWIDIEDDADALGDDALDVENFPTLMLLRGAQPVFYGTLLPHATTLQRLLEAVASGTAAPGGAAQVSAGMAAAVARLAPQRPLPRNA